MADVRGGSLLKKQSFRIRALSGIILAIVLVAVFILGYGVMWAFVLVLSLLGEYELYKAIGLEWGPLSWAGYLATIAYYIILLIWGISAGLILAIAIFMIVDLGIFVVCYPKFELMHLFGSIFGVIYIGVCLSFLYLLRIYPPYGAYLVWLVVISAWGCDTCAYLVGMKMGRQKFFPELSPNKSKEGAIGGVIGAMIIALIYAIVVSKWTPGISVSWLIFPILVMFGSIAGEIGDLAASAIKRKVNIKDYSNLIPGHGGILDRFDSMIMVAPIIYIITIWFKIMPS